MDSIFHDNRRRMKLCARWVIHVLTHSQKACSNGLMPLSYHLRTQATSSYRISSLLPFWRENEAQQRRMVKVEVQSSTWKLSVAVISRVLKRAPWTGMRGWKLLTPLLQPVNSSVNGHGVSALLYLPYSPGLAHCYFWLFGTFEDRRTIRYWRVEDLSQNEDME